MKRFLIASLIAVVTATSLVSCGNKEGSTSTESKAVQAQEESELSDDERAFLEFMKTDLSEEEKVELFNGRLEQVKAVYDDLGIAYEDVQGDTSFSSNPNVIGISYDDHDERHLLLTNHSFYLDYGIEDDSEVAESMNLVLYYDMELEKSEAYSEGTEVLDFNETSLPAVYKAATNTELDVEKFNGIVSKLFQAETSIKSRDGLDKDLNSLGATVGLSRDSFISVSADYDMVVIMIQIPLREKI